jgi:hypothetical protein
VVTVHLEQRGVDVKLGKPLQTAGPGPDTVRMRELMKAIPPSVVRAIVQGQVPSGLPAVKSSGWGWGYEFGADQWGMCGNGPAPPGSNLPPSSSAATQGAGGCWWAMFCHRLRLWAKTAGRPIPEVSDLTLLEQYSAYVASVNGGQGYDLQTGSNDLGTDPLGAYTYLEASPFKDDAGNSYPVGPIVSLTPGDVQEHIVATKLFVTIGVGVQLQQAQVDQFDQGQPLAYVKGSPVVGGHELLEAGPNGMIEWGEHIPFEPSFIARCNDQSEATLSTEMFSAITGLDASHSTEIDVERYVSSFTKNLAA